MMPAALLVPPQLLSKKTLPKQPTSNPISINTRTPVEPLPSANLSHKQPPAPLNCKEKPKQVAQALKNPGKQGSGVDTILTKISILFFHYQCHN